MTWIRVHFWVPVLFLLTGPLLTGPLLAGKTARDYVNQMEERMRGSTSRSRIMIRIQRHRFGRTLILDSWEDRRSKRSFLRILRPKKDRGVTFLKIGNRLWQYIPKIGREIRIEGSLLHDSWMGSDFTNDDLVRSSSTIADYKHSFLGGAASGTRRILLEALPTAAVAWQKIIMVVRERDAMPQRQEFYDHRGRLSKVMVYSSIKRMGGRLLPTVMTMESYRRGRKLSSTRMVFLIVRFNVSISPSVFSRANLRR